ncbi:MAG: DUF333 domain-containing protein [bacterium]
MKQDKARLKVSGGSVLGSCILAVLVASLAFHVPLAGAKAVFEGAVYVKESPLFTNVPGTIDGKSSYLPASQCLESDSGALDIEGVRARTGENVRVAVRIQHAPCQVDTFGFDVTYPEQALEFLGFDPGDLAGPSASPEVTPIAPGRVSIAGVSSDRTIPKGASGYLVWLNFKAKEEDSQMRGEEEDMPQSPGNVPQGTENTQGNTENARESLEQQGVGIANPASVYCINQGGRLEIRKDAEGNQYGVCIFSNGSECEEWAYFRGECKPAEAEQTVQESRCYTLQLENLRGSLASFSSSPGCICIAHCQEGDLNADGKLTPEDALIAFRCYLKLGSCSDCADVNQDGSVTPADALCIFKSYLTMPSCLDPIVKAAPAPIKMEGAWQSQNNPASGGKLTIDRENQTVEMADSPYDLGQGYLMNFHYTPTGGSSPISFQAGFNNGNYTADFTGTASNSLCPPGVWCIWAGQFLVDGKYSLKDSLGQLLDEGTFNLAHPLPY